MLPLAATALAFGRALPVHTALRTRTPPVALRVSDAADINLAFTTWLEATRAEAEREANIAKLKRPKI